MSLQGEVHIAFLERIEELRNVYGMTDQQLLNGLPELLRGDTLLWYRNSRDQWHEWEKFCTDFREYYLPRRYRAKLVREIQGRLQMTDKPYRKFATELATMMRRAGGYSIEEQLDTLYENMHPRYKLYISRERLHRAADILRQASEIEDLEAQCKERERTIHRQPPPPPPPHITGPSVAGSKDTLGLTANVYQKNSALSTEEMNCSCGIVIHRMETPRGSGTRWTNPGPRNKILTSPAPDRKNPWA